MSELNEYYSVAEAITVLLHPHAEVVIHDLKTGKIAAIFNNFSKRKIGDDSLIEDLPDYTNLPDVFPVYTKINWDGIKLKSTTATLRDKNKVPIGLLCINLDVSKWEEFRHLLDKWSNVVDTENKPEVLFKDDWREKINLYVSDYLKREGLTLKALSKENKRDLIQALYREGGFKAKNAAAYLADVLDLSRATVYNYLSK
ncbi:helix-turn-helix transcriptional regulator [Criblamydia sequanensis]|uniref:helix-turn-helix transcriptional regulator n=1 Tax=Candidatus Criblamydia sequanensis TaxID=340071 RepID=UPI001F1BCB5B|nr:PAS domain-containing protein [Criblamydia sequanensis]